MTQTLTQTGHNGWTPVASLRALAVSNVTDVIGGEVVVVTARVGDVGVERSLRGAHVRSRPAG